MGYAVKELFKTLQREGAQTGRPAVFCRFAGWNSWSGRESDRAEAICSFCGADFVGIDGEDRGRFPTAEALTAAIIAAWAEPQRSGLVVFTEGEPLQQLDEALISAVAAAGFTIAVETNGALVAPEGINWICVSPKSTPLLAQTTGSELKLIYPQADAPPNVLSGSISSICGFSRWTARTLRSMLRQLSHIVWQTPLGGSASKVTKWSRYADV